MSASAATHLTMRLSILVSGSCPVPPNPAKLFFFFFHFQMTFIISVIFYEGLE